MVIPSKRWRTMCAQRKWARKVHHTRRTSPWIGRSASPNFALNRWIFVRIVNTRAATTTPYTSLLYAKIYLCKDLSLGNGQCNCLQQASHSKRNRPHRIIVAQLLFSFCALGLWSQENSPNLFMFSTRIFAACKQLNCIVGCCTKFLRYVCLVWD